MRFNAAINRLTEHFPSHFGSFLTSADGLTFQNWKMGSNNSV